MVIRQQKTRQVWASGYRVHEFPFSPLNEQKSERDPQSILPRAHHPCIYFIQALLILKPQHMDVHHSLPMYQ